MTVEFKINQDLKKLIPPLSAEEFAQLERNCIDQGIRDPLVVWDGVIVDGHNRYKIAQRHGLEFNVVNMNFANVAEVEQWMDENQIGRRNLHPKHFKLLLGRIYNRRKKAIGAPEGNENRKENKGTKNVPLKTRQQIAQQYGIGEQTVVNAGRQQQVVQEIATATGKSEFEVVDEIGKDKHINEIASRQKKQPDRPITEIAEEVLSEAQNGEQKQDESTRLKVHFTSDSEEWYTPNEVVDAALTFFGTIDLDPCSNSKESPSIPAKNHYTKEDNGLAHEWRGTVYMNPPYGRVIAKWVEKAASEYECGNVTGALLLVPARTDTAWMARVRQYPRCYVRGRLKFSNSSDAAPFPSCVIYLGDDVAGFYDAFYPIGDVYQIFKA